MGSGRKNRIVTSRDADCIVLRAGRVGVFDVKVQGCSAGRGDEIYVVEIVNTTTGASVVGQASRELAVAERSAWTAMADTDAVADRWATHAR